MLAVLLGGIVVAVVAIILFMRATRTKANSVDPIASTTGASRALTGTSASGDSASVHWDEALRRFSAPLSRVRGRVSVLKGTFSGGTLASGLATIEATSRDPELARRLWDVSIAKTDVDPGLPPA